MKPLENATGQSGGRLGQTIQASINLDNLIERT